MNICDRFEKWFHESWQEIREAARMLHGWRG